MMTILLAILAGALLVFNVVVLTYRPRPVAFRFKDQSK